MYLSRTVLKQVQCETCVVEMALQPPQVAMQELILSSHKSLTSTTAHYECIQYYHTPPLILTAKINGHYSTTYQHVYI